MKNRNTQLTAILFVVAFALASIVQAGPRLDGGPIRPPANEAPYPDGGPAHQSSTVRANANSEAIPEGENRPVITIHDTDSVKRGKTGSFVLDMHPLMFGGMYVNSPSVAQLSQELITFSLCPRPTSDKPATE